MILDPDTSGAIQYQHDNSTLNPWADPQDPKTSLNFYSGLAN